MFCRITDCEYCFQSYVMLRNRKHALWALGKPGFLMHYGQENLVRQGQLQIEVEEKELAWFRIQEELDTLMKNMQDDTHD